MSSGPDLKSSYFFFGGTDPSDANRRVTGPCRLYDAILYYRLRHNTSDNVKGNFQIKDGSTSSGDIKFQIPIISFGNFGTAQTISMMDGDGYIRFDNGMYLDHFDDSGDKNVFESFAISLLYTGGSS
jgi:hypothetical protein